MSGILNFNVSASDIIVYSTSSRGNQPKWLKDSNYVKADGLGYEGLAECISSNFAKHTNIEQFMDITMYYPCTINHENEERTGAYCKNFLNAGESVVSLWSLLINNGFNLESKPYSNMSTVSKIESVVNKVVEVTGFTSFPQYLTALLEFDSVIYNDDRHFRNIALIEKDGKYNGSPLFDNGAALFSDCFQDYPIEKRISECRKKVRAKPFSRDFEKQVKACQELYGNQLKVTLTSRDKITWLQEYENIYKSEYINRAISALKLGLVEWENN